MYFEDRSYIQREAEKLTRWLADPSLLCLEGEASAALASINRCRAGTFPYPRQTPYGIGVGVDAAKGIFRWAAKTGLVSHGLTHRALATLHAALDSKQLTPDNSRYVWGGTKINEASLAMQDIYTAFKAAFEPFIGKGKCNHEEFDAFLQTIELLPEDRDDDGIRAIRLRVTTKQTQIEIAKQIAGNGSTYVFQQLERSAYRKLLNGFMRRSIRQSDIPDDLLKALALLSKEEINGRVGNTSEAVCALVIAKEISEPVGERIIRIAVDAGGMLSYLGDIAGCPECVERTWPTRSLASDYLPEPIGFTFSATDALQWVLKQTLPADVKLVMMTIAALGCTGVAIREQSGLTFRRWVAACKYIHKHEILKALELACACSTDS
jgi:hypothetical protein